jgi:hypothetical protein
MSKKRNKSYRVKVFTNMRNPFGVLTAGGQRTFYIGDRLTKTEALRAIRRTRFIYPYQYKFRIVRSRKGVTGIGMFLGLAMFILCLGMANATPDIFTSLSASVQDLIRIGFLTLGLFGLFAGVVKK